MLVLFSISALSVYFSSLCCVCFVSHPLGYCLLLVVGGLSLSLVTVISWGVSWYLALFVIVYVGGVYVLFLFVSVHSANSLPALGAGLGFYIYVFFFFLTISWLFWEPCAIIDDESRFLCSGVEGASYLILCFSLLIGFTGVSVVSGQKDSFFR